LLQNDSFFTFITTTYPGLNVLCTTRVSGQLSKA